MGISELGIIAVALVAVAILTIAAKIARVRTEVEDLFERIERAYPQPQTDTSAGRNRNRRGTEQDRALGTRDLRCLTEAVTQHHAEQPEPEHRSSAVEGKAEVSSTTVPTPPQQ